MMKAIRVTHKLHKYLTNVELSNVPTEQKERLLNQVEEMLTFYRSQIDKLEKEGVNAVSITFGLLRAASDTIAMHKKHLDGVQCKKGCAACCHLITDISLTEAETILSWMEERGQTLSPEQLKHLEQQEQITDSTVFTLSGLSKCVFLSQENTCSIYEVRPFVCRNYMVVNDPKYCDTKAFPGYRTTEQIIPEAEIIYSAFCDKYGEGERLAKQILTVFKKNNCSEK